LDQTIASSENPPEERALDVSRGFFPIMAKPPAPKLFQWRITRIRATPAALIGYVNAPDAEQAIKEAIREFGITDPEQQRRLAAQPVKEIKRV
jgi:hypothetical protein